MSVYLLAKYVSSVGTYNYKLVKYLCEIYHQISLWTTALKIDSHLLKRLNR